MRWRALIGACLLATLRANEVPHWTRITSPHFELLTTAGERSGSDELRYFEEVRGFFQEAMGLGLEVSSPVRIVVFRTDKEYEPYAPNEIASAYYLGTDDGDTIVMKSAAADHYPSAVHEYTHLLVKHSGYRAPMWFNEGLAELYSNLKPVGGKVKVGEVIPAHYATLRKSQWIDLPELLAVTMESPLYNVRSHAGLFYAESWALVHMLYLSADYRPHLPALLAGIRSGAAMPETFRHAYGKSLIEVQADLQSYMASRRFEAAMFNVKLEPAVERLSVTDANPLEVGLALADIQASITSRLAEGRQQYERLIRDYPKDWRAEEALAKLSMREDQRDEALGHYARAAERGCTKGGMYLDYGRLLRFFDKDSDAVPVLTEATRLEPDNQEARVELALALLVDEQHPEALSQFQMVKKVPPERAFGYWHGLAYVLYRVGRKEEGKAAAAECRPFAKTPEQQERLNQLVAMLNYEPKEDVVMEDYAPAHILDGAPAVKAIEEELLTAEGTLRQIECASGKVRMRISEGAKFRWFGVDDLNATGLRCGSQPPWRVRLHYARPDLLRNLEFVR